MKNNVLLLVSLKYTFFSTPECRFPAKGSAS